MTRASRIEKWLVETIQPTHFQVLNESHTHNVPAGSETHFRLVVVSPQFEGKSLVDRHRFIFGALQTELEKTSDGQLPLHALSLQLYTPTEWQAKLGVVPQSPDCVGGDGSLPKRRS